VNDDGVAAELFEEGLDAFGVFPAVEQEGFGASGSAQDDDEDEGALSHRCHGRLHRQQSRATHPSMRPQPAASIMAVNRRLASESIGRLRLLLLDSPRFEELACLPQIAGKDVLPPASGLSAVPIEGADKHQQGV